MKLSIRTTSRCAVLLTALGLFSTGAMADSPDGGAPSSQPSPVPITLLQSSSRTASGFVFLTPSAGAAATPGGGPVEPGGSHGAEIVDDRGLPVWFHSLPAGTTAFDLRVQRYRGEPVLTWIESRGAFSTGPTVGYIADRHYRVTATVQAENGLTSDIHELVLTREGTALIPSYHTVPQDLTAFGGPASGLVTEGVVQEIDVATGRVLFEWHSLDHIALDESHSPAPTTSGAAWDYFHLNAVSVDEDGNLLIGARNTWAAYRLDRRTGEVLWRLGGTKSDFALGPDVAFAWQHNPTAVDHRGLVRIFDNEASPAVLPYSRVIWVRHDDRNRTATLERWFKHPEGLSAGSQGNAQALDNGDTFVGWGQLPRFSEFDAEGQLLFDGALPSNYSSYRAYRFEWEGAPDTPPTATAESTGGGVTVHAIWNGATEVARWEVLDGSAIANDRGDGPGAQNGDDHYGAFPVASGPWSGLDTVIPVTAPLSSVVVVARDRAGRLLGRSSVTPVSP
jgi:hypothetical protein